MSNLDDLTIDEELLKAKAAQLGVPPMGASQGGCPLPKFPYPGEVIGGYSPRDECAARMHTKGILDDKAYRLRLRAQAIQVLTKVIPWEILSHEDEQMLYDFFKTMD